MTSPTRENEEQALEYEDTQDATYDTFGEEEAVSYLVPRLAAYAAPSSSSSASNTAPPSEVGEQDNHDTEEVGFDRVADASAEEDRVARMSGERSAAHVTDDGTAEDLRDVTADAVAWEREESIHAQGEEEVEGDALYFGQTYVGDAEAEEVEEPHTGSEVGDEEDDKDDRDGQHGDDAHSTNYANAFAYSRVKELLKYEGSSSMVSKDAAAAACEAVALLTRDLVAMAAAEATRKHRKTLAYDDVARVAQMLDRFSFLADVVPPLPSSASSALGAGKSIVVGSHVHASMTGAGSAGGAKKRTAAEASLRSKSTQVRGRGQVAAPNGVEGSAAARSKTAQARSVHSVPPGGVHPLPGGMRQATLRF